MCLSVYLLLESHIQHSHRIIQIISIIFAHIQMYENTLNVTTVKYERLIFQFCTLETVWLMMSVLRCLEKKNVMVSDSQVWGEKKCIVGRVDSQRNFNSEAAARTGGAQECVANKSVFYKCHICILAAWQHSLGKKKSKKKTKKKLPTYCKKMGKWIPQTTVTNFYHIHEAVLSQHAFIVLFEHMLITCLKSNLDNVLINMRNVYF